MFNVPAMKGMAKALRQALSDRNVDLSHGDCLELTIGGTVIGPMPESRFRRGIARVRPGELLVGVTDGLLERRDPQGREFGLDRLKDVVRRNRRSSSDTILEAIFDASRSFGADRPFEDDATAVVVRRLQMAAG